MPTTHYTYGGQVLGSEWKPRLVVSKGSEREIGQQHAEQVGEDVQKGMLRFYYDMWNRMSSAPAKSLVRQAGMRIARLIADPVLANLLMRSVPPWFWDRLNGVRAVSGVSEQQLRLLVVLPDLLPFLQALVAKAKPQIFVPVNLPRFGCTTFFANGDNFLYGRNLDFPGVAYWDRYPVIQLVEPSDGLKYVGFTTAGIPLGGITGINEAQISVGLHQHYSSSAHLKGVPPYVIGEEILKKSRSIEDAIEIIEGSRVATAWAFLIADGKRRRACLYECHAGARGVRWLKDGESSLCHSNHFQTESCQAKEYAATSRMNWDNLARRQRLESLTAKFGSAMGPADAVKVISDHYDSYWECEKPFNRTVSQVYNIQSLVLDPVNMKAWVAKGRSPIHLRDYEEWDLGALLSGGKETEHPTFPGFRFTNENTERAKQLYIDSFVDAMDGQYGLAAEKLSASMAADSWPEIGETLGLVWLRLGEYEKGLAALDDSCAFFESRLSSGATHIPPEFFECHFFRARALDLLGKRSEALKEYRFVAKHPKLEDANLRRLALSEKAYKPEHVDRMLLPYSSYIPYQ